MPLLDWLVSPAGRWPMIQAVAAGSRSADIPPPLCCRRRLARRLRHGRRGIFWAGAWAACGLRVPARNALLADVVHPSVYGRAYGFERPMDNLGRLAARCWPSR
jgi:hypothetical protein